MLLFLALIEYGFGRDWYQIW